MNNVQAEELVEYAKPWNSRLNSKLTGSQVRLWCQGHVHELGGRPGRCCAVRFRSIGQGGRDRQAYRRDCMSAARFEKGPV
jgi:hypothetical protein